MDSKARKVYNLKVMNLYKPDFADCQPSWKPPFLQEIEAISNQIGLIDAVHKILQRDNIAVDVEGDLEQLENHQNGLLFVGDHTNRLEFIAIMDILSQMERDDMLNIAKFYVKRRVQRLIGHSAAQHILPVYPRILATDRKELLNSEIFNRLLYRRQLLTTAESEKANARTIATASECLGEGGVVNIFPRGSALGAASNPWRSGVGKIIQHIPPETRGDVLIAPYSMSDVSRVRLVAAIAMRGRSVFGRPQTMTVRLGPLQTAAQLVDSMPEPDREDPLAITARLRQGFIDHFYSPGN